MFADSEPHGPTWKHPFERAGLGTAPFRVMGYHKAIYQACPGAPIQTGACCDRCGQGIMHVYQVCGSAPEDKVFKVGIDCVLRTRDTELGDSARKEQRAHERAERDRAYVARKEERDQARAEQRRQQAVYNLANMPELIDQALVVSESGNASAYDRKIAGALYTDLTEGERGGASPKELKIVTLGYFAALLPASAHVGKEKDRLRGLVVRYEGGPIVGIDSFYGPSRLCKFRVTEGPHAGAVLVWKTKYAPCKDGAIVKLTGTVKQLDAYEGVQQTWITRAVVEVVDESGAFEMRD